MRAMFAKTLIDLAKADPRVLLLTGDHGYALFDQFRSECPKQYINAGIAEQNMVGVAAGLARSGFFPVVYGLSAFVPIRVIEQIKLDVAHDGLHVLFIGDGAGFVYSHLGTSHQSTEDIACTRVIPGLRVFSPADQYELASSMLWAYDEKSPAYLRIGKSDRGDVQPCASSMLPGQLQPIREGVAGGGLTFIATGSMVSTAAALADSQYQQAAVWSAPSIKPLDVGQVISICTKCHSLIVLEEHSVYGGLGSLIAEIASQHCPVRVLRIGTEDRFSKLCGDYDYLLFEHGLDFAGVSQKVASFLSLEK